MTYGHRLTATVTITTAVRGIADPQLDQIRVTAKSVVSLHYLEGVLLKDLTPDSGNVTWTIVITVTSHNLGTETEDKHVASTFESGFRGLSRG